VSRPLDLARIGPQAALACTVLLVVALSALLARVGADAGWLAALGHVIAQRRSVPAGVPFAFAPTGHWPNALVLAELIFAGLESTLGDRGLMLAQLIAVAGAMAILARDAREGGAEPFGTGAALLLVALGALPSLAIARVQMFSLILFPALVVLLRTETRGPSSRIWLAVPLLALWSNLHGAALLGAGTLLVYLVFSRARRRPVESLAVGAASIVALCLTPAGLHTVGYYAGVLTNLAAQRGEGMWGPLSLSAPLDVVTAVVGVWLAHRAWRARMPRWEVAMAVVLVILTVKADRDGVWLLFFLAAPAARAMAPERFLRGLAPLAAALGIAILAFSLVRGPVATGASRSLVSRALAVAHGSPVLADGDIDEQVALAGGRIWAGNPIDAFSHSVQASYLDWVAGARSGASALAPAVRVVVVTRGTRTQTLMAAMPDFVATGSDRTAILYERIPGRVHKYARLTLGSRS
jgi:hypothetical protein